MKECDFEIRCLNPACQKILCKSDSKKTGVAVKCRHCKLVNLINLSPSDVATEIEKEPDRVYVVGSAALTSEKKENLESGC